MLRSLCISLIAVSLPVSVGFAQQGPSRADLEQQRKQAESLLNTRTREYEQARKEAQDRLGDNLTKYEAKKKELLTLLEFQRHLMDDVPWAFTRYKDGKPDKPEMATLRQYQVWLEGAKSDESNAINDDFKAKSIATHNHYKSALANFKSLILDPLVKVGPLTGTPDSIFGTYDELVAGIKELEQVVSAYEKKLGDTAKRLADTQAKMDAARTALDEAEGRLTGKWKLDKVILYAEKKEQVGGSFTVWNQQTGIYWKTEILTPTSVTNLGRKYMVVGTFTPPPPLLEPGKPFDVVFQGRFSKSEENVGWPGVLMDVLEKATIDGKSVNKAVFEVNPKRQNPTDRFTFTAPPAKSLDVWRFGIRAWNTPNFGIVYQYKPLK